MIQAELQEEQQQIEDQVLCTIQWFNVFLLSYGVRT
jgi:hypothetical protein